MGIRRVTALLAVIAFSNLFGQVQYGSVFNVSADSTENIILVDKSRQQLVVVKSPSPGVVDTLEYFRVTTGKVDGNKQKQGDLKTPEGIYRVIGSIPGDDLPEMYGPLALILDYPNFMDKKLKRTGNNIWIHGRNEEIVDKQTRGCVSLENSHILHLEPFVKMNRTPVIICDTLEMLDSTAYDYSLNVWKDYFDRWANSWADGHLDTFFNFYDKRYRGLESFKANKKRLEKVYPWKEVVVDNIVVLVSKHEARATLEQTYISPKFSSKGEKSFLLAPSDSSWRIIDEDFSPVGKRHYFQTDLNRFVDDWIAAWESGSVDTFMTFYSEEYNDGSQDYSQFKVDKTIKFKGAGKIKVIRGDIRARSTEKWTWKLTFRQRYESQVYKDVGYKTLVVTGKPGDFQIISESWKRNP